MTIYKPSHSGRSQRLLPHHIVQKRKKQTKHSLMMSTITLLRWSWKKILLLIQEDTDFLTLKSKNEKNTSLDVCIYKYLNLFVLKQFYFTTAPVWASSVTFKWTSQLLLIDFCRRSKNLHFISAGSAFLLDTLERTKSHYLNSFGKLTWPAYY